MTYTDLFYAPGDNAIRCHTLEGKRNRLQFCALLSDDEVGAIADSGKIMNCEAAARHIMEPMVSLVEKPTI
jgi:hypothetical protein